MTNDDLLFTLGTEALQRKEVHCQGLVGTIRNDVQSEFCRQSSCIIDTKSAWLKEPAMPWNIMPIRSPPLFPWGRLLSMILTCL